MSGDRAIESIDERDDSLGELHEIRAFAKGRGRYGRATASERTSINLRP